MKINFLKVNSSNNMIVLILDPLPRNVQNDIATEVMKDTNIGAEKVAFIETVNKVGPNGSVNSYLHLQMMGGELCSNSPRALAAIMHYRDYPELTKDDNCCTVDIHISGICDLVRCSVEQTKISHIYNTEIIHPLPVNTSEIELALNSKSIDALRVDFEGITHFIVDENDVDNKTEVYDMIKFYMSDENYYSFGILFYDNYEKHLTSLIYVKDTNSLVWEKSCGTGAAAIAFAISQKTKSNLSMEIRQPGGILKTNVLYNEHSESITKIKIKGPVKLVAQGTLLI